MDRKGFALTAGMSLLVSLGIAGALLAYSPSRTSTSSPSPTNRPTTLFPARHTPSPPVDTPTATAAPIATVYPSPSTPPSVAYPRPSSNTRDIYPPTPVSNLRLHSNTASVFVIAWDPSFDYSGVHHYAVKVNGQMVKTTRSTRVELPWLTSQDPITIEVLAQDNNGNRSEWRRLVVLPPPLPTTTPSPETPTPSVDPSLSPSPEPSSAQPTPTPSNTPDPSPGDTPELSDLAVGDQGF